MGDFKNMQRDLRSLRRQKRAVNWRSVALECASWLAALGALVLVLRYLT